MMNNTGNLRPGPLPGVFQLLLIGLLFVSCTCSARASQTSDERIVIGSKRFTEAYVLGEIITQRLKQAGQDKVILKSGLGNTGILFAALTSGEIDLYPEYTGTITRETVSYTHLTLPTNREV